MVPSEATQEAVYLKSFMRELGEEAGDDALTVFEDNQCVIALAKSPAFHERIKHIDIRYHTSSARRSRTSSRTSMLSNTRCSQTS